MTKKHFEWAAAYVRDMRATEECKEEVLAAFSYLFRNFNDRFRADQFDAACRGEDFVTHTCSGRAVTRRYSKAS